MDNQETKWNKTPYSYREYIMLALIIILMIGFTAIVWAEKKTIESYQKPYNECMKSLDAAERGLLPVWENSQIPNIINQT